MLVPMWNDTDIPLTYLITFRCYGTWLHGAQRGSIDRFHNRYKSPYIEPNESWKQPIRPHIVGIVAPGVVITPTNPIAINRACW